MIYRSKMHATLKRNFQVMSGTQWLQLLIQHIPDKHEHLVRYYGAYSSRYRGAHKGETKTTPAVVIEEERAISQAARAAWAKLIYRVYEVDPLICPRCGSEMRVIAVINDGTIIRKILEHLKLWDPRPVGRGPPTAPDWPAHAQLPLTYHPVPDIA